MKKILSLMTCVSLLCASGASVNAKGKAKNNFIYSPSSTFKYAKVSGNKWSFKSKCVSYPKLMVKKAAKSGKKTVSNDFSKWTDVYYPRMKLKTYTLYSTSSTKYYDVLNTPSSSKVSVKKISKKEMMAMFKNVPHRITQSMVFHVSGNKIKNVYLSEEI